MQDLFPQNLPKRMNFCRWLSAKCTYTTPSIHTLYILSIVKSCFTRNGILNYRNIHLWADENPHSVATTHYQHTLGRITNDLLCRVD